MKVDIVIPESSEIKMKECSLRISKIIESKIREINLDSVIGTEKATKALSEIENDPLIELYIDAIKNIYSNIDPRVILIAETDEDKRILEVAVDKNDYYRKRK